MATQKSALETICQNKWFWILFPGIPLSLWLILCIGLVVKNPATKWLMRQFALFGTFIAGPGREWAGPYVLLVGVTTIAAWWTFIAVLAPLYSDYSVFFAE